MQPDMQSKMKYLELIQAIVSRLANSMLVTKGWSISITSALTALSASTKDRSFVQLALFPAALFWILDGYFLAQERQFRSLYDEARKKDASQIDLSLNAMPQKRSQAIMGWLAGMLSPTGILFHGTIVAVLLALMFR